MYRVFSFIFILLLSCNVFGQQHPFAKKFPLVDTWFDSLMKEWNIPGLALGIVYKDQLIYGKGYGYRDLEKKLPVKTTTLFPIASNTKLFTATAACMLAEEGKLNLNRPVKEYLPSINFNNDELNAKVTLLDMLSHRTGLPRYDGIWINATFGRKDIASKISYMRPQYGFREGYIYNNMMFSSAGVVMEQVTGLSWEEIIRQKLFLPLNMNASCFTTEEMKKYSNYSLAYFEADSTHRLLPKQYEAQSAALGPAGTIKSNVEDMSHWMIAQLNKGYYKDRKVISQSVIRQTLEPNAISDKEGRWDELSNSLYCLGRSIQTYKGVKIASHTGSIDGFFSHLVFLPKEQLAIFVVFNANEAGSLRSVIAYPVIDRLLGLTYTPWDKRYRETYVFEKARGKKITDSIRATQVKNTSPSHPLSAYVGTYANTVYGNASIELVNGELIFQFRRQRSVLKHFHYDQFVTDEKETDAPDFRLQFLINNKGDIDRISMRPYGDPQTDFVKQQ
jgi:CubicO group peptidase (beta-lactamase class C family)